MYARRYGPRAPSGDTSSPAPSPHASPHTSPGGSTSPSSPHPHTTAVRRLALLSGAHAVSPPPPGAGWRLLSVHGADDAVVPISTAELWHVRHRDVISHDLRLVAGADHTFSTRTATEALATTLNDWLEGARRLSEGDGGSAGRGLQVAADAAAEDDEEDLCMV